MSLMSLKKPFKGAFEDDDLFRIHFCWMGQQQSSYSYLAMQFLHPIHLQSAWKFWWCSIVLGYARQKVFYTSWFLGISTHGWTISDQARPWIVYQWFCCPSPVHLGLDWFHQSDMGYSQWCHQVCYPSWSDAPLSVSYGFAWRLWACSLPAPSLDTFSLFWHSTQWASLWGDSLTDHASSKQAQCLGHYTTFCTSQ